MELMLDKGVDAAHSDKTGKTALHWVCRIKGYWQTSKATMLMPLVKCLVEAGANINARTKVISLIIYHPLIYSTLHRLTVL